MSNHVGWFKVVLVTVLLIMCPLLFVDRTVLQRVWQHSKIILLEKVDSTVSILARTGKRYFISFRARCVL